MVSTSTSRREGIVAVTKDTEDIKESLKNSLSAKDLTLHFDGKALKEYSDGCHLQASLKQICACQPNICMKFA